MTMTATLSDAQLCRKAWELAQNTSIKEHLPLRYTVADLAHAHDQFDQVVAKFIAKYGDRLKKLDSIIYTELTYNNPHINYENNDYDN